MLVTADIYDEKVQFSGRRGPSIARSRRPSSLVPSCARVKSWKNVASSAVPPHPLHSLGKRTRHNNPLRFQPTRGTTIQRWKGKFRIHHFGSSEGFPSYRQRRGQKHDQNCANTRPTLPLSNLQVGRTRFWNNRPSHHLSRYTVRQHHFVWRHTHPTILVYTRVWQTKRLRDKFIPARHQSDSIGPTWQSLPLGKNGTFLWQHTATDDVGSRSKHWHRSTINVALGGIQQHDWNCTQHDQCIQV